MSTGSYVLVFKIPRDDIISIGKLGAKFFPAGVYLYIGSAMGKAANTLENRIKRHLYKPKRKHWHIDYLLTHHTVALIEIVGIKSRIRLECKISQLVNNIQDIQVPVVGFGATDCVNKCPAHLYRLNNEDQYKLRDFTQLLENLTNRESIQIYYALEKSETSQYNKVFE